MDTPKFTTPKKNSRASSKGNPKGTTYFRLTSDAYKDLERQMGTIHVSHQTTDLQAGYMLGVEAVMRKLRAGFVIG